MARSRRNKVFDLFKSNFQITFFYKPVNENDFYYVVLDDVIKIRIKVIREIVVIDMVVPISKSYITPLYDKLIESLMGQDKTTVLVSTMVDTYPVHSSCIKHNAPLIEDEEFLTVSKEMYQRWKTQHEGDLGKYGSYILAVSKEDPLEKDREVKVVDQPTKVKKEEKLPLPTEDKFDQIRAILKKNMKAINIGQLKEEILECFIDEHRFVLEWSNDELYIKEFLQEQLSNMNLIQKMEFLNTFEEILSIVPNIYLVSVQNMELYRLCLAKGYEHISEEHKLPSNKLFKQAFLGYGTFRIVKN